MVEQELIEKEEYGVLGSYLLKDEVTDIDYNGRQLWVIIHLNLEERINQ